MAILSQTTLSAKHLEIFRLFYRVIRISALPFSSPKICDKIDNIVSELSPLIIEFIPEQERSIYVHMMQHLSREIRNWGPMRSYWLFCFERMCGYLRLLIATHKHPESSCFNNFSMEMHAHTISSKDERSNTIRPFVKTALQKESIQSFKSWYNLEKILPRPRSFPFVETKGKTKWSQRIYNGENIESVKLLFEKELSLRHHVNSVNDDYYGKIDFIY